MLDVSFPSLPCRLVPRPDPCKQAVLGAVLLLVAGCGGAGGGTKEQLIRGSGYAFSAPQGWTVERSGREVRASMGVALVSVERFPLLRVYRPALWQRVVPELDRAADTVAAQQHGSVADRRTVTISGLRARRYDVAYQNNGKALVERIAFVLKGKTEYLLLCRYESGGDTDACDGLVSSFKLAAA
jgi:hypothetical protein